MRPNYKPLNEQIVLITGASSGIGRQSAVRFSQVGAKVICIARNEDALADVAREIWSQGGEALYAVADVADLDQLKAAAEKGVGRFGRIDTWVNDAGVGMYARILETNPADDRRLFDTNFWGIVNGSRLAVPYLRSAGGGALINVGSVVSDVAMPVQGMYATSKHAVKGFTDALREELLQDRVPVSVTLIKPAAIDTPFPRHAKNYFEQQSTLPAPIYDVDLVADQILHAATHGNRELNAGGGGRAMTLFGDHFPSLFEWAMAKLGLKQQLLDRPADHSFEGLHESRPGFHRAAGDATEDHHVQRMSLYGVARRHPLATVALAAIGAAAVGAIVEKSKED